MAEPHKSDLILPSAFSLRQEETRSYTCMCLCVCARALVCEREKATTYLHHQAYSLLAGDCGNTIRIPEKWIPWPTCRRNVQYATLPTNGLHGHCHVFLCIKENHKGKIFMADVLLADSAKPKKIKLSHDRLHFFQFLL